MKLRSFDKTVGLITVALMIAPWLRWGSASDPKFPDHRVAIHYATLHPRLLFADLDGDALLDEAKLSSTGQYKNIRVSLSASWTRFLSFDSGTPDPGRLVFGDIDHDNDQDLVWYSQTDPGEIFFWLNDGKGSFGLATRYRLSDRRPDLDLNSLLSLETGSQLYGQQQNIGTTRALRADDSVVIELAARREAPTRATTIILRSEWRLQSIYLKTILKRGPPAWLS
jgi:hypothetical protein